MVRIAGALLLSSAMLAAPLAAETYEIDPAHSGVTFRVKHLMVSKVSGRFEKFEGAVEYEPGKPERWSAAATIDAASVNTKIDKRDAHLRSAEFFDAEKFPKITFKSTKVTGVKGDKAKLAGDLTMHGVTKSVVLDLEIGGVAKDPMGNAHFGATATGRVSRKDFGITWNKALEAGGVMVGDEVEITIDVEAVAKKS